MEDNLRRYYCQSNQDAELYNLEGTFINRRHKLRHKSQVQLLILLILGVILEFSLGLFHHEITPLINWITREVLYLTDLEKVSTIFTKRKIERKDFYMYKYKIENICRMKDSSHFHYLIAASMYSGMIILTALVAATFALHNIFEPRHSHSTIGFFSKVFVYGGILFTAWIVAIWEIQDLLHNPEADKINYLYLQIVSVVWIAASLICQFWILVMGIGVWGRFAFFEKLFTFVLTFLLSAIIVASPVVVITISIEAIRFL